MQVTPELKRRIAEQAAAPVKAEVVEDEASFVEVTTEDYDRIVSILDDSMRVLGFYGDINLAGTIVKHDRKRMVKLAEELRALINDLAFYSPLDEEADTNEEKSE